ncbi:MAG: 23S rRNA (guanosine(2251)-2'-O)-methyltransferase RlmB [Nitrospirales bacterium]|nr:MAG: 23S rRNA (guanosine(2251)-2'-O)-methyltransferase RlmB [Nitrospirales bacterium]
MPRPTKFAKTWRPKASLSKTDRTAQPAGNDNGQEFVYGLHALREVLRAGTRSLLRLHVIRDDAQYAEIVRLARSQEVPISVEPRDRINRLVPQGNHQGIVGLVTAKSYVDEDELLDQVTRQHSPAFVIVLDNVQDPQNLGAILRTADAAGIQGIFIPKHRSVGLTSGVARASAGAVEYMRVARASNTNRLVEKLQSAEVMTCALDPSADIPYTDVDFTGPTALVFGAEGQGIRPGVLKKCDYRASIPMLGRIDSLNLSVSVAIVLFEAMRQRRLADEPGDSSTLPG